MLKLFEIILLTTLLSSSVALKMESWKIFSQKQIVGSVLLTKFNKDLRWLKEKLKWPEKGWHLSDVCNLSCHLFACIFIRRPTEEELCLQPRNRDHACCQMFREQVDEITGRHLEGDKSQENDTHAQQITTTTTAKPKTTHVPAPTKRPHIRKDQDEKKLTFAELPV